MSEERRNTTDLIIAGMREVATQRFHWLPVDTSDMTRVMREALENARRAYDAAVQRTSGEPRSQ